MASIRFNRALTLARLGRHAEALKDLHAIDLSSAPADLGARIIENTVEVLVALGRARAAITFAKRQVAALTDDDDVPTRANRHAALAWALWAARSPRDRVQAEVDIVLDASAGQAFVGRDTLKMEMMKRAKQSTLLLVRSMGGERLKAGHRYVLQIRGEMPAPDDRRATEYLRVVQVLASSKDSAVWYAFALEPREAHATLSLLESKRHEAVKPGTLAGVCWRSGRVIATDEDP